MGSLADSQKLAVRKNLHNFIPQLVSTRTISKGSIPDEFASHVGLEHFPAIYKSIQDYIAPLRNSNSTGFVIKDELSEYITFLEMKNRTLVSRITELEIKVKTIDPYLPTIIKIIDDYMAAGIRIEEKKKYLIEKYSLKKNVELEPWTGAKEKVDIADLPLDEMLSKIEE